MAALRSQPLVAPDPPAELARPPLILNRRGTAWISGKVSGIAEGRAPRWWWAAFLPSAGLTALCFAMIAYLVSTGIGVWGLDCTVGWAWDITNFVFWIGIGHAGTLISAILFLLRQPWRTSISRAAEAMTLFAVICAAIFPVIHLGRPWDFWWLFPIPNANAIWPQFRSPLTWDVFAISTYFVVSLMFWYVGMIPDLATLRDRARTRARKLVYGLLAMGWTGSIRHWRHYEKAYLLLAGLSTPLVLSVHSIVSFDFAASVLPGWHTTIFPPYFVAGAIFSGMAMVLTLLIPIRTLCGLEDVITVLHIDRMGKVLLAAGSMVGYAYAIEWFTARYSGSPHEIFAWENRAFGPYAWAYWTMLACNAISPQLLWLRRVRRSMAAVFLLSIAVNVGMWLERFVIIVTSLHRDFLPSSWSYFRPTLVDIGTLAGSLGLFLTLFLLFIRFLPMIAMAEIKGAAARSGARVHGDPDPPGGLSG